VTRRRTKVVLTVDTEASIAGAFGGNDACTPLIHELVARHGRRQERGAWLSRRDAEQVWANCDLLRRDYASPLLFRPDDGRICRPIAPADQDVQLHFYPCWLSFKDGKLDRSNFVNWKPSDWRP
jgi:hypothetical protein